MGSFSAKLRFWDPTSHEKAEEVEALVDTGAAAVWVASNGFTGPDTVVVAERNDMEVIGVHTIEGLGLAADPVQKKLVPTVGLALRAGRCKRQQ